MSSTGLTIGVDATNLRDGGGVTHLVEILRHGQPESYGISKVVVFGGQQILNRLEDRNWLIKIHPNELNKGIFSRLFWQKFKFIKLAREVGCNLLFIPGGSFFVSFKPIVTMSRNMLPFDNEEMMRYGWSLRRLRLILLRYIQSKSMRRADGLIFLTKYAQSAVLKMIGPIQGQFTLIPHGLSSRFKSPPKEQRDIASYSLKNPFKILYVSTVDEYKHQWSVVAAAASLYRQGYPIKLDLVGPAHYQPSLQKLQNSIAANDPQGLCVEYHGSVAYDALHLMYTKADLGVFASSCENMPNILLESMAAGLPLASSNKGPTTEILGDAGFYFDPLNSEDIASAIKRLIESPDLRTKSAQANYKLAEQFSWGDCADKTFSFLTQIALKCRDS